MEEKQHNDLVAALREVLTDAEDGPLLIKRVPFICQDIKEINEKLDALHDFPLVKAIVFSFAGTILMGVLAVAGMVMLHVIKLL